MEGATIYDYSKDIHWRKHKCLDYWIEWQYFLLYKMAPGSTVLYEAFEEPL